MSSALDLVERARHHYSSGGISSLIHEGVRFAARDFWLETLTRWRYVSRSELKKIAKEENGIWYGKEEESFRIKPASHPVLREEFELYPKEYSPQTPFVCELSNCYLLGQHALGLTERGKIISETTPRKPKRLSKRNNDNFASPRDYLRLIGLGKQTATRRIDDRVFLLVRHSGYYHWMVEYLPKIRLLEHYTEETGNKPTVLVESNPSRFVKETLEAVGYEPDEYEEWDGGVAHVSSLIIPIHRTHRFNHYKPEQSNYQLSRDDLTWLRDRIRNETDERERRLYISRQKADERKVDNYDEVTDVINEFGFEPYVLEDLPFRKQVELFEEAEIIMGPHGAGLTNMIFADDPLIIEMLPEDTLRPHFYFISGVMGFDYKSIITEGRNSDLIVDVDSLRDHLVSLDI